MKYVLRMSELFNENINKDKKSLGQGKDQTNVKGEC